MLLRSIHGKYRGCEGLLSLQDNSGSGLIESCMICQLAGPGAEGLPRGAGVAVCSRQHWSGGFLCLGKKGRGEWGRGEEVLERIGGDRGQEGEGDGEEGGGGE